MQISKLAIRSIQVNSLFIVSNLRIYRLTDLHLIFHALRHLFIYLFIYLCTHRTHIDIDSFTAEKNDKVEYLKYFCLDTSRRSWEKKSWHNIVPFSLVTHRTLKYLQIPAIIHVWR